MHKTVGDVLTGIISGKSIKTLDRPALPHEIGILKISAVTWGEFRAEENKAMPSDFDANGIPRALSGDILISRANTRELVGAPVIVDKNHYNLLLSDKLLKLIPNKNLVDSRYLLHSLKSEKSRSHFSKCAGGTSGSMTNITQSDIRSAPIYLPSLEEQRRIAAILDKAEALRAKRREAIAKLDQLLQSVFLEMFGDPVLNPKKYLKVSFGDLIKVKSGNGLTAKEMQPGNHAVYGGNGISGYHSSYMFDEPKIVIGRVGFYCGAVHRTLQKSWVTDNALYISELHKEININYLEFVLRLAKLNQYAGQAAQPLISGGRIYPVETIYPPIDEQEKFSKIIEHIEKEKEILKVSYEKFENLNSSLQHQYFS